MNFLHDCYLEDQDVTDEENEMLKCNRKDKIEFLNACEETLMAKGHFNDEGKLDGSTKAHCRRFS